jgi:MFS superfamily sulfate permease-like transporter
MADVTSTTQRFHFHILEGVLPIKATQAPYEIIAGITLAALAIPEVMGYTKIAGSFLSGRLRNCWLGHRRRRRR